MACRTVASTLASDCPAKPYIKSRLNFSKPAARMFSAARRFQSRRVALRPTTSSKRGLTVCTPMLMRRIPRERTARNFAGLAAAILGVVSMLISTSGGRSNHRCAASTTRASWETGAIMGVPPPMSKPVNRRVPMASPHRANSSSSKSKYGVSLSCRRAGSTTVYSQNPQRASQNGMWTYSPMPSTPSQASGARF